MRLKTDSTLTLSPFLHNILCFIMSLFLILLIANTSPSSFLKNSPYLCPTTSSTLKPKLSIAEVLAKVIIPLISIVIIKSNIFSVTLLSLFSLIFSLPIASHSSVLSIKFPIIHFESSVTTFEGVPHNISSNH